MPSEPSKYASNQFLVATTERFDLMDEVLADHLPRLLAAAGVHGEFQPPNVETIALADQWLAASIALINAEAVLGGAAQAFADKLDALTRQPDPNTNAPLEIWDLTIRTVAPAGSPLYHVLLPQGRTPFTDGTGQERLEQLQGLATRLGAQVGKPTLLALATVVQAFYNAAAALRQTREDDKPAVTNGRDNRETLRAALCVRFLATIGVVYVNPALPLTMVNTLWNWDILRDPPSVVPAAPATAPAWVPATRTLSVPALPLGATRLVAYRLGPGGAPELLATGGTDELAVVIPADITFVPGSLYQLWVAGKNGRGVGEPSPSVSWTAPL